MTSLRPRVKGLTMSKLEELISRCKGEVIITINPHRGGYQTVENYFDDLKTKIESFEMPGAEAMAGMIAFDTIIDLQFYPDTPIGSYQIYYYDLDRVMYQALDVLKEADNGR